MTQLYKITESAHDVEAHDFGCRDSKGRAIGADIHLFTVEYSPVDDCGYRVDPATNGHFAMRTSATRNGICYGATQPRRFFKTAEEREVAKQKYLADARKRAAKKAK